MLVWHGYQTGAHANYNTSLASITVSHKQIDLIEVWSHNSLLCKKRCQGYALIIHVHGIGKIYQDGKYHLRDIGKRM